MKIYYIVGTDFARKNATGVRVLGCSNAIEYQTDNKVTIFGFSNEREMEIDNFKIHNVRRGHHTISKIFNTLTRPAQFLKKIKSFEKPDVIIYYAIYGNSVAILKSLKKYCTKNNIKLIVDITEWYDCALLKGWNGRKKAKDVTKAVTEVMPTCDGVIAISSYLQKYFEGRGVKTIRVPLITETKEAEESIANSEFDNSYLNLIFAGSIGSKEMIVDMAREVIALYDDGKRIKLNILGVDSQTFARVSQLPSSDAIVCHGKIKQNEVIKYLKNANFSVLLRPDILNTRAGFPTKFVESLNAGLPVIANLTSDIGDYLVDGKNGVVIKDTTSEAIKNALIEALNIGEEQLKTMKTEAKNTAVQNFDFRNFSDKINDFLSYVKKN